MLQKNNRQKVLEIFFEDPIHQGIGFQLREISRRINLAPPSVKKYLQELQTQKLIIQTPHRIHNYPVYSANQENNYFKLLKKLHMVQALYEVGFIDFIENECMPDVVILFGSAAKGEDTKDSDIDIFIQCKEQNLILEQYEKKLHRNIHVFFSESFGKLSKELKNNLANGVVLKGYLTVFS
ncbi:hypothetical protein CL622_06070 [archaeon]|nr:hypothetical protein [archaeon]